MFDFALDKAHVAIRYPRKKENKDFRFFCDLVGSPQELIFAFRLTTLKVEQITTSELSQIQAHKISSLKFLTAKVFECYKPCIIEFPNLELMDLELNDSESSRLLFKNCVSLLILKLKENYRGDGLHLKVQNAEKLETFELITRQPHMIEFDSTSSLRNVTIDVANELCFL